MVKKCKTIGESVIPHKTIKKIIDIVALIHYGIIQRQRSKNILEHEYHHLKVLFQSSVVVWAPLMLMPDYMFRSDEKGQRTTEAVMSEMISVVTHNT